jgi:hypothetical protein
MNPPRHGTINGYRCDGCRCADCTEAKRLYTREQRRAYLASGRINHGTASAWDAGCRCGQCRANKRASDRRRAMNKYDPLAGDVAPEGFAFCPQCKGLFATKIDGTLRKHGAGCLGTGLLPNGELPPVPEKKVRSRRSIPIDFERAAELLRSNSILTAAVELGICDNTLLRRMRQHPELIEAHKEWNRAKLVHGTINGYQNHKCRCDVCRDAYRERMRRLKLERIDRASEAPHGTASGYKNWNCRCAPCKKAGSEENRRTRLRRLAKMAAAS